jgi:hypothetical protein
VRFEHELQRSYLLGAGQGWMVRFKMSLVATNERKTKRMVLKASHDQKASFIIGFPRQDWMSFTSERKFASAAGWVLFPIFNASGVSESCKEIPIRKELIDSYLE